MIKVSYNPRLRVFDVEHEDGSWFVTRRGAATELRLATGMSDEGIDEVLDDLSNPESGVEAFVLGDDPEPERNGWVR